MINFNNVSEILMDGRYVEQIAINGIVVWGSAQWFSPVQLKQNLYVRSALYQDQKQTNLNLGFVALDGGEES